MTESYLLEIPIYWKQEDKFDREYERDLKKHLEQFEKVSGHCPSDKIKDSLVDNFWKKYIAPWRFNQAIGWIRIYKLGTQLRGEVWIMNARRAGRRITKKQFSMHGKAFELSTYPAQSSMEIFTKLNKEISAIKKIGERKVFLDVECINNIGPHVDWKTLMK